MLPVPWICGSIWIDPLFRVEVLVFVISRSSLSVMIPALLLRMSDGLALEPAGDVIALLSTAVPGPPPSWMRVRFFPAPRVICQEELLVPVTSSFPTVRLPVRSCVVVALALGATML
jgi:hypothetical protein